MEKANTGNNYDEEQRKTVEKLTKILMVMKKRTELEELEPRKKADLPFQKGIAVAEFTNQLTELGLLEGSEREEFGGRRLADVFVAVHLPFGRLVDFLVLDIKQIQRLAEILFTMKGLPVKVRNHGAPFNHEVLACWFWNSFQQPVPAPFKAPGIEEIKRIEDYPGVCSRSKVWGDYRMLDLFHYERRFGNWFPGALVISVLRSSELTLRTQLNKRIPLEDKQFTSKNGHVYSLLPPEFETWTMTGGLEGAAFCLAEVLYYKWVRCLKKTRVEITWVVEDHADDEDEQECIKKLAEAKTQGQKQTKV